MTCEEFRSRLTAFSLGELEAGEAEAAREHVGHCSACASAVLLDRQLTALLRSSAVPAPRALRNQVRAALRAEAAQRRAGGRRRHWLAFGSATGLAAAVIAAALLLVPAPARSSPLAAAWTAYRSEARIRWAAPTGQVASRLNAVLGPAARTPDLSAFGLHPHGWGARDLAGHLAAVAEYRSDSGRRVALIRWRGQLPRTIGAAAETGQDVETVTWGGTGSAWWRSDDGVVWCLIGSADRQTLERIAERLYGES
jgi:anti-sigma factor RsiW